MKWLLLLVLAVGLVLFLRMRTSNGDQGRRVTDRKKRDAAAKEPNRAGKPFAATSVKPGSNACAAALALEGKRYLVAETPELPLNDCDSANCQCTYLHHDDRRDGESDRRLPEGSLSTQLFSQEHGERRKRRGRRKTD